MVYISSLHSYISNELVSSNVKYNHFLSSRLSLSVLELRQIMPVWLADYTAGKELHLAPKMLFYKQRVPYFFLHDNSSAQYTD